MKKSLLASPLSIGILWLFTIARCHVYACQFYPLGEYLRFVRIPENLAVNAEVIQIEVHPRRNLSLQPVDKAEDVDYFKFRAVNKSIVSVRLAKSLEDLVDSRNPQSVLKFRMICDYQDGDDTLSSYLSVSVYVEDINDNSPVFVEAPYSIDLNETTQTGSTVFDEILAVDRDKPNTPNSDVHYTIVEGNEKGKFSLEDSSPSSLILQKPLNYSDGDTEFLLTILATDRGVPQRNATTTLTVNVIDNDDLNPKFSSEVYHVRIPEFHPITGRKINFELPIVPRIYALDQDKGINSSVRYDIVAGNENHLFYMDPKNASIFLKEELDVDSLPSDTFNLQIQATQTDNPLRYDTAKVQIKLIDINDNLPEFEVDVYNISIVENLPNGFSVLQVVATDRDQGENAEFVYQLVDPSQTFSIDGKTGWLSIRNQAKLDREQRSSFSMRVLAREKLPSLVHKRGTDNSEPFVTVDVTLLDANDNNPKFVPNNMYEFNVSNNAPVGTVIGKVEAVDPDLAGNGDVVYSIEKGVNITNIGPSLTDNYFDVNPKSGNIIIIRSPLPPGRHTIFLEAADQPVNPTERRFALAVVTVHIYDTDEKLAPEFIGSPYEFWVGHDVSIGTSVGQIRVEGIPTNDNRIMYDLLHSYHEGVPFAVEERSGTISVVDEISRFDKSEYYFEAVATDGKLLTATTNVTIHVVDSELNAHMIRNNEPNTLSFRVRENQSGALIGHLGRKINSQKHENSNGSFVDGSPLKNQRYVIVNQPDIQNKFAISADGAIYTHQALDREEQNYYQLVIFVESAKKVIRGLYHVNITVEDENDNAPLFDQDWYVGYVKENSPAGTELRLEQPIKVQDADSGVNAHFILILKGNGSELFLIDQRSRAITVRDGALLDREYRDTYNLRIVAKDRGNLSSEAKLTIHVEDVNDHNPRFVQMIVHHREGIEIISGANKNRSRVMSGKTDEANPSILVPESTVAGTPIVRLRAADEDASENAELTYHIVSETYIPNAAGAIRSYKSSYFAVHPITGEVTVTNSLPAETDFIVNVSATDRGGLKGFTLVKIHVKDVNNNAPHFDKTWYDYSIAEGVYRNHVLSRIQAIDDDFGENGKVSYSIEPDEKEASGATFPFRIIGNDGTLIVDGELDREVREFYTFRVLAEDNAQPPDKPLRSSVEIDVRVSDLNDNYPIFYGYDRLMRYDSALLAAADGSISTPTRWKDIPVYRASVPENAGFGISVAKVYANDSDLAANGNGMVLFHIPRTRKNQRELFTIDSKDGTISTLMSLDYEEQPSHNITVLASDLGNPSLTSTALVIVDVVDIQEIQEELSSPIFAHRYYEMQIEENCAIPLNLLALNVSVEYSRRFGSLRFTLITDHQSSYFKVDSTNGSVQLVKSPDRELTPTLQAKIRVDRISKKGKSVQMIYPMKQDSVTDLAPNEVKIIIHVMDQNDNAPVFNVSRPMITAIPNTAPYGYLVAKLKASDSDIDINADIRYDIVRGGGMTTVSKFAIDPISGHVKTAANFLYDSGQMYSFDVKATDMAGAPDGKSSTLTLIVFVLDDQNKVTVVAAAKPTEVEANMKNITSLLSDISGLDVRVRKIEPHYEKDAQNSLITNLHLYAIDTMTNSVVENEVFGRLLKEKELEIKSEMEPYHFLGISSTTSSDNEIRLQRSEKTILSGLETMTVMLGCIIFLGALTAATCVACFNRKRSKYENGTTSLFPAIDPADLPFSLYTGSKSMNDLSACRPRSLFNPLSFVEDSNVNTLNNNIAYRRQRRPSHHHNSCMQGHSDKCVAQSLIRSRSAGGLLGASVASLHSSERDSGIEAAHNHRRSTKCQCKHSVFFSSSANSSNGSYEDSLKSLQAQHSAGSDSEPFNGRTNQKIQSNFSRLHKELSAKQAARIRQSLSRLNI